MIPLDALVARLAGRSLRADVDRPVDGVYRDDDRLPRWARERDDADRLRAARRRERKAGPMPMANILSAIEAGFGGGCKDVARANSQCAARTRRAS